MHELYPCNSKQELYKSEGEIIKQIGRLSSQIAGRTHKESNKTWVENNRDKHNQINRRFYEKNKDLIEEKRGQKFECECGGRYTLKHKSTYLKTKKHLDNSI